MPARSPVALTISHTDCREMRLPRLLRNSAPLGNLGAGALFQLATPRIEVCGDGPACVTAQWHKPLLGALAHESRDVLVQVDVVRFAPVASETRQPVAYMNSSRALSRNTTGSVEPPTAAASSRRVTSSTVSTSAGCWRLWAPDCAETSAVTRAC